MNRSCYTAFVQKVNMGQYYVAVILDETGKIIRTFLDAHQYNNGSKLTEHSYIGNQYMTAVESLICPEGMFYKSRVVWAGDYADPESDQGVPLYELAMNEQNKGKASYVAMKDMEPYRFIVNHTKKLYVDKNLEHDDFDYHPLSLLTAEGNGRGGGDYKGQNMDLIGTWARDVLSVEREFPEGYTELECDFAD